MTYSKLAQNIRKWSRNIHRDLSYFLSGMIIIYAASGIAMNHRDTFNPNYSVEQIEYKIDHQLPAQKDFTKADVINLLTELDEEVNYTKHYFPKPNLMKVFLKGGSNLMVNVSTNQAVYEKLIHRPILSAITGLHYNPGRWWTWFADFFAIGLILITFSGIIMIKGKTGLVGRGGIELGIGMLIPLLFLFL